MKTLYGLSSQGIPTHISTPGLARGLACNCTCPSCGENLIAKLGQERAHHFAHAGQIAELCKYAYETELHIRAKNLIEVKKQIKIPLHSPKSDQLLYEIHPVSNVRVEKFHTGKKPDLIVTIDDFDYLIEIAVTHFADPDKKKTYRANLLNALEIDLSPYADSMECDIDVILEDALFSTQSNTKVNWISLNPLSKFTHSLKNSLQIQIQNYLDEQRKIKSSISALLEEKKSLENSIIATKKSFNDEIEKLNELKNEKSHLLSIQRELIKKNLELDNYNKQLEYRVSLILDIDKFLINKHNISLSRIEFIQKQKILIEKIYEQLGINGFSENNLKILLLNLKKLNDMEDYFNEKLSEREKQLEQLISHVGKYNSEIEKLHRQKKELIKQRDYYQLEVSKLHRTAIQAKDK